MSQDPTDEQRAFEAAAFVLDFDTTISTCGARAGKYASESTMRAWLLWQHLRAEQARAAQPAVALLPRSDSQEAAKAIDVVLAERNWPISQGGASRAGFEAACRMQAAPPSMAPGEQLYRA